MILIGVSLSGGPRAVRSASNETTTRFDHMQTLNLNRKTRSCAALSSTLLLLLGQVGYCSDAVPGAPQKQPIALIGGTIHPVSGPAVENGVLLFDEGRIVSLGTAAEVMIPENSRRIDLNRKHVYPGLFESHSYLGLVEISAVRATRDSRETGSINPNVRAHVSVNPDSELIPVTRSNGILLTLTSPQGGLISGQAGVMQLDGWTYEDMTLLPAAGMVVNWPSVSDELKPDEDQSDRVQELRDLFDDVRAYRTAREEDPNRQRTDLKLEALLPVLDRKIPLLVRADGLSTIQSAVAFGAEQNVRLILLGGYDAPLCAELLNEHDVPVILSAVYRLPRRRGDAFDASYTLPERLRKLGVQYCISGTETARNSNVRNLPYHAATAVAYGLPYEEALKAITLYPAQILGVADRVGSLDPGKDATLIVTTGDPLETPTQVVSAFVQGREVDLSDRHKRLYRKYQQKYDADR